MVSYYKLTIVFLNHVVVLNRDIYVVFVLMWHPAA